MALAARLVGCTREALYRHAETRPEIKDRFADARAQADDVIVKKLYDRARDGDMTAIIFWLKNRRSAEWRDRHDLSVSGQLNVNGIIAEAHSAVMGGAK